MPGGTRDPQMVARLMARLRGGDPSAAGHLMETYYPELRRMAGRLMKREGAGDTWQPTVLINELFLELVRIKRCPTTLNLSTSSRRRRFWVSPATS
jgi:ECF sigma factor